MPCRAGYRKAGTFFLFVGSGVLPLCGLAGSGFPAPALRRSERHKDQFGEENRQEADCRDAEQSQPEPRGDRSGDQRDQCRPGASRDVQNGGKRHDRQGDIRNVIEERLKEAIGDLLADERQGEDADEERDRCHDENIKADIMRHDVHPIPRGKRRFLCRYRPLQVLRSGPPGSGKAMRRLPRGRR